MTVQARVVFSSAVRAKFEALEKADLIDDLERFHGQLVARRREAVDYPDVETISEATRAVRNVEVLSQAHLHRAERLMASSGSMIADENIYGLTLLIRGHIESTSILGFLCERIASFGKGGVLFERVIHDIAHAMMGARHPMFSQQPDPVNILSAIEKADRYFERKHKGPRQGMLADCYAWLSDFAHPNFLSGDSAICLDKAAGRFEFRHGGALSQEELEQLGYLAISAELFVDFFDDLADLTAKAFANI